MLTTRPTISVIIPTWRRGDLLRKCLESLRKQTWKDFEAIIVSNAAGDWVESFARESGAKLVRLAENRGFATAINAGIGASKSPLVVLLNDDAELDPAWLEQMAALLEQKREVSFACGKIYQADGRTLDEAGDALSLGGGAWRLGHGRPDSPEFDTPRELFAAGMTAAIFRREVFDKVGLLDENFISYLEDMDFSLRLKHAGLRGIYWPQATARHHGGASLDGQNSAERFRLMTRNQLAAASKNFPRSAHLRVRILWAQALWFGMAIRKGLLRAYLAGVGEYLSLRRNYLLPQCIRGREPWSRDQRTRFLEWLRRSERAIYEDISARPRQQRDTYWRLYFALFRPGRGPSAGLRPDANWQQPESEPGPGPGSEPKPSSPSRAGASSR